MLDREIPPLFGKMEQSATFSLFFCGDLSFLRGKDGGKSLKVLCGEGCRVFAVWFRGRFSGSRGGFSGSRAPFCGSRSRFLVQDEGRVK